jgi:hypothetical protein
VIPSGTVQVKCKYCKGTILVPPEFGGAIVRCPNHPDILAVGLCNDCSGNYCDNCLYLYKVRDGTLHLCSNCVKKRETQGATVTLILGALISLVGFLFIFIPDPEAVVRGLIFIIIGIPYVLWGISKRSNLPKIDTLRERNEAAKKQTESRKSFVSQASTFELYNILLNDHMRDYGAEFGWRILEREIDTYMQAGMTRSEALRKLAIEKGY